MEDDSTHEINEEYGSLNNVLLRLGQVLCRIPACTLEKVVMDAAVQVTMELAQVLPSVSFGNAMLFPLVFRVCGNHVALALPSAQLLQGWLSVDLKRAN